MKLSAICIATLMAASPVSAQDFCGGVGNGGQWIGGTRDASDITTTDDYREQVALVMGGNTYTGLFSVSDRTPVRIEAAGRGAGDPVIEVFDADGAIVSSDDDSGGGGAARTELDLSVGTYCVTLKSYEDTPMSAFMRIGRQDQEALTPGVTAQSSSPTGDCSTATPFGVLDTTQSASATDTNAWSFTLAAPTAITITATNEAADPTIALLDSAEVEIAANDDHDGLNARIEHPTMLPAGDYCLRVGAISDASVPIAVSIARYDPAAALAALYDRGEAAPPRDGSVMVTDLGLLQSTIRQDMQLGAKTAWYAINIAQSSLLLAEAVAAGESGDPWLVIYDSLGRQIGVNDDANGSLNSMLATRLQEGTYTLGVKLVGEDAQGFVQLLLERYVRAD